MTHGDYCVQICRLGASPAARYDVSPCHCGGGPGRHVTPTATGAPVVARLGTQSRMILAGRHRFGVIICLRNLHRKLLR